MTLHFNPDGKLKLNRFSKLGMLYVLALSVVVTIAVIGQVLIQDHLKNQLSDSHIVNVAGRQRMLSQKITKCALLLKPIQSEEERSEILNELQGAVSLWKFSHQSLQGGNDSLHLPGSNSLAVMSMFKRINDPHVAMANGASTIVASLKKDLNASYEELDPPIEIILKHQKNFLEGMNLIVFQYDSEAKERVARLSQMEYILLIISILVIVAEMIFVFRPTTLQVNSTVNQLIDSEKNARKLSKEIGALYASLEKSYEELSHVNVPVETPKIYAKTDRGGNILFISDLFTAHSNVILTEKPLQLKNLFPGNVLKHDWMDDVIEQLAEGNSWHGTIRYHDAQGLDRWSDVSIVPTHNELHEVEEWLVLGSDITRQKHAELTMHAKSKAEIEKKINQQKFRSVLILEGQEEERKRLAMDIHDGIGQMLTSLKFQIESIDVANATTDVPQKLSELKQLTKDVIKEVRRVTFNLKPTVLGDYGLQAALNVFVREIGKLSDIELTYSITGDASIRLPQKVENNIFRIIQEAINNAIKYSEGTKIEVLLQQGDQNMTIEVKDNGNGFDEKMVEARSVNIESGRGFFNMYERTEYVNGLLDIKSIPGQGTSVILTVPVRNVMVV